MEAVAMFLYIKYHIFLHAQQPAPPASELIIDFPKQSKSEYSINPTLKDKHPKIPFSTYQSNSLTPFHEVQQPAPEIAQS
jgi:hypothetical protein